jgi:hypothetical protein
MGEGWVVNIAKRREFCSQRMKSIEVVIHIVLQMAK